MAGNCVILKCEVVKSSLREIKMIKIKLSAGSKHSRLHEARAIKNLQHILSREDGYLIPIMFVGEQLTNREIDAVLLLPDIIFFLDFKNWPAQRIEVEGLN